METEKTFRPPVWLLVLLVVSALWMGVQLVGGITQALTLMAGLHAPTLAQDVASR